MTQIQTASGLIFDYASPRCCSITLEDITHSLSQVNRFSGHTRRRYCVLAHCLLVGWLLRGSRTELQGYLHDASEAYTGDISTPLKSLVTGFKDLEHSIEKKIGEALGVDLTNLPAAVKVCDRAALATEAYRLMPKSDCWQCFGMPLYWDELPLWWLLYVKLWFPLSALRWMYRRRVRKLLPKTERPHGCECPQSV